MVPLPAFDTTGVSVERQGYCILSASIGPVFNPNEVNGETPCTNGQHERGIYDPY